MSRLKGLFEPRNDEEREEYALQDLALSIQLALQKSMNSSCVSQRELADKLGVSAARVSQLFSSHGANLTLKTIAKIAMALGEDFEFVSKKDLAVARKRHSVIHCEKAKYAVKNKQTTPWMEISANDNLHLKAMAA
jgi:transcriptional regulator with XRE-family HTH domain